MKYDMNYAVKKILLFAVLFGMFELINNKEMINLPSFFYHPNFIYVLMVPVGIIGFKWKYFDRAANRTMVLETSTKDNFIENLDFIKESNTHNETIAKVAKSYLQMIHEDEISFRNVKKIRKYINKHTHDKP